MSALAISWTELTAGVWTPHYTQRPCAPGLIGVSRRWPAWRTGTPPTWAEFVAAREIFVGDRCWLVAHVLLVNRRRLVAWAVDCVELVVDRAGPHEAAIRAEVIAPLRAWATGDNAISPHAVSDRAWQIRADATYPAAAAAFAATTAVAVAHADDDNAAGYAVATAITPVAADRVLGLALPYLTSVCEDQP